MYKKILGLIAGFLFLACPTPAAAFGVVDLWYEYVPTHISVQFDNVPEEMRTGGGSYVFEATDLSWRIRVSNMSMGNSSCVWYGNGASVFCFMTVTDYTGSPTPGAAIGNVWHNWNYTGDHVVVDDPAAFRSDPAPTPTEAPTPTPTTPGAKYGFNSNVQSSASDLLGSLVSQLFRVILIGIGIIGALMVTLFGLRWLIKFVRGNLHG